MLDKTIKSSLKPPIDIVPGGFVLIYEMIDSGIEGIVVKNAGLSTQQKLIVFQQNGSGQQKIAGLEEYGGDLFDLVVYNIDEVLPPILDNTDAYLPKDISCDLVLDFLKHNDLSTDLAALCAQKSIPIIASGKKITCQGLFTPPT